MSGWVMFILLALLASVLLALIAFPRRLWMFAATALTLGATGYVVQGKPDLAGHPVANEHRQAEVDPDLLKLRDAMFGNFALNHPIFVTADALARGGDPKAAAEWILNGVGKYPNDAGGWAWLGLTLADRDGGIVSPSSRFAFDRAVKVAPKHPGPPFFLGYALIRSGQVAEARPYWARAVELTPANAEYRDLLVQQLANLDARLHPEQPAAAPTSAP
jgi:cytochrome c-type biogenesis protein CcmH